MKNIPLIFLLLLLSISGCKRHLTQEQVKNFLQTAMEEYLNSPKNTDTSKVRFTVLDVIYYEDKTVYDCQFKVKMHRPINDTTGMMGANISKDFSIVKRNY